MECLIIPGIIAGVVGILFVIYETSSFMKLICLSPLVLALIICPAARICSKISALVAQSYYEYIVTPNIVEEYDTYVIVGDAVVGIWQAGGYNVAEYNGYIKSTSYLDAIPILGSVVYPVPSELKFVIVK